MDHIDNFSLTKLSFKKSKKNNSIDKYSKRELISEMISTKSYLSNYRNKIINSFILFGCWNHIDCCSKNSKFTPIYRDIIIKQAKKNLKNYLLLLVIIGIRKIMFIIILRINIIHLQH